MKARYLTFFSYIGTPFRSSQKIWQKEGKNYPDPGSIQGLLEIALKKLKPLAYPSVTLSSRTDGGVHALNSSAHFDLERYGSRIYEPNEIAFEVNKFFYKSNTSIYIKKCLRVCDNFSARYNAVHRTYLYRLAILNEYKELPDYTGIGSYIPIEEWRRCHFIRTKEFDIERLKEGAKYLVGYHDFTTFKKFTQDKLPLKYKHSRREIYSIDVRPGRALVTSCSAKRADDFDYWDIEFKGKAFVHNQIRRMMGTLISVATGKLQPEDIRVMLQVPSKNSWHNFIQRTPPDGLYLCNVEYKPEDLLFETKCDQTVEKIEQMVGEE